MFALVSRVEVTSVFLGINMKNVLIITLLITFILFTLSGCDQNYMKWGLPEHAILRLGKGSINDLKHSQNGDLIAVATSIGVWIYDADSGKEIRLLRKHSYPVNSLAFSPNGKMLASGASDGIHLWDPHTGQHLFTLKESAADNLVFFPDGHTLGSTSDKIIRLWDISNRTISKTFIGHTKITSFTVSPDGKTIISRSIFQGKKALYWWDVETGSTMFSQQNVDAAASIMFSPNGEMLACVGDDVTWERANDNFIWDLKIYLLDGSGGEILKTLRGHKKTITTLAFSPDGKMLAGSGWEGIIHLWDSHSGQYMHTFRGHTSSVSALSFSSDNKTLVSGSDDGTVRFWDTATKQQRLSISGHWQGVDALAFSADSKTLISGITDATIHKWDIETGQLTSTLVSRYGEEILAFHIGRDLFACRSSDFEDNDEIIIRSIDTGNKYTSIDIENFPDVTGTTFSHDGETLVFSTKEKVKFCEIFSSRLDFEFVPHENVEYCNNLKLEFSKSTDHTNPFDVVFFENILENIHSQTVHTLASSPDSKLLAIYTKIAIKDQGSLWKFGTNEFIRLYRLNPMVSFEGSALAFSNDSKTLAIGDGWDIGLIEVDTGNLITTLSRPRHNGSHFVIALAFSPNGKILASGSEDGTILIWDLDKIIKSR